MIIAPPKDRKAKKPMKKAMPLIILTLIMFSCKDPISDNNNEQTITTDEINLLENELVYKHHSALAPGLENPDAEYDALIYCRVVGDTTIGEINVYKYRFIKVRPDTAETTMNYMEITDTSVINHAYWGNSPFVFLKSRKVVADFIKLEETPYSTILFPYRDSAYWYTRPESSGVYSTKLYTNRETMIVEAGKFDCAKVYTQLLPEFRIQDLWAEQWWCGNVLIKSFINYGVNETTDEEGRVINSANSYETFELKEYRKK